MPSTIIIKKEKVNDLNLSKVIILIFGFLKFLSLFILKNQNPFIFKHYISIFLILFLLSKALDAFLVFVFVNGIYSYSFIGSLTWLIPLHSPPAFTSPCWVFLGGFSHLINNFSKLIISIILLSLR